MNLKIIQNAIKITDGKKIIYLASFGGHDFKNYQFKDGREVYIDGGLLYIRRGYTNKNDFKDWSLNSESPFDEVIEKLLWGQYKNGIHIFKPLYECSARHLRAILKTQTQIKNTLYEKVIKEILNLRKLSKLSPKR